MPLPQVNLDSRRFDDLVAEMRALIPRYAPEWTNHNPSDPGITLIELLAWVTEATLYRTNRIPETTYLEFAKLLLGHVEQEEFRKQPLDKRIAGIYRHYLDSGKETDPKRQLEAVIRCAVKVFNEPFRAVTAEDFVREAVRAGDKNISRVRVLSDPSAGQVAVVIVPATGREPDPALLQQVREHLDARRLVGTQVFVRGPVYSAVNLEIKVALETNTRFEVVKQEIQEQLGKYLHPLTGGRNGGGWPFGRPVSIFELYHLIEAIPGVDHVERLVMNGDSTVTEVSIGDLPDLRSLVVDLTS
jgi:hypothetical protein